MGEKRKRLIRKELRGVELDDCRVRRRKLQELIWATSTSLYALLSILEFIPYIMIFNKKLYPPTKAQGEIKAHG